MSKSIHILGMMSGSSLDGMDLALIRFQERTNSDIPDFEWVATGHFSYSDAWIENLKGIHELSIADWMKLDIEFCRYVAQELEAREKMTALADVIGWHGHTSAHHPEQEWTLALGNGQTLSTALGKPVMAEFRRKDVAQGGQGAPLAPIVDAHFFPEVDVAINLGGIANMTLLSGEQAAFDVSGCNQVLNHLAEKLGSPMDTDGQWAAAGSIQTEILEMLNSWSYLNLPAPKSLNNQSVSEFYGQIFSQNNVLPKDALATTVEHITHAILSHLSDNKTQRILLSGGGARNLYLIRRLREKAPQHDWTLAPGPWVDYKEAFLMAYMAYRLMNEKNNVFSCWTGGERDHQGGMLYNP